MTGLTRAHRTRHRSRQAEIADVPNIASMTPGSTPSRRGLARPQPAAPPSQRPALTAPAPCVLEPRQVGTKKRPGP